MSYLKVLLTPTITPITTLTVRYKTNNEIIIKPLNKISIAQANYIL